MTKSSATMLPLEILENILNQFDQEGGKSLLSAALVCRRWSSIALPILWKGYLVLSPNICRLNAMRDDGSLSKYIHLIHCLTLDDIGNPRKITRVSPRPRTRPRCPQKCNGVRDHFPFLLSDVFNRAESITSVKIRLFQRELPRYAMHKLLPPNLRNLTLHYRISCFELLETLEEYTPHLESLRFRQPPSPAIPNATLLKFIRNMPRLRILQGACAGFPLEVLRHLEKSTTLESLRVWHPDLEDRNTHLNTLTPYLNDQPMFRGLKDLRLEEVEAELADLLIPSIPNLETLDLMIVPRKDGAFPHFFSSLKKLQTFRVGFVLPSLSDQQIRDLLPPTDLIKVYSACPNLKTIEYIVFGVRSHKIRLTASEFQQAWAGLATGVVHVCLPFSRDCGRAEIQALAKRPFLRTLQIRGRFDIADLEDWPDAPSLPSIRSVEWKEDTTFYKPLTIFEIESIVKPILPRARYGETPVMVEQW